MSCRLALLLLLANELDAHEYFAMKADSGKSYLSFENLFSTQIKLVNINAADVVDKFKMIFYLNKFKQDLI